MRISSLLANRLYTEPGATWAVAATSRSLDCLIAITLRECDGGFHDALGPIIHS